VPPTLLARADEGDRVKRREFIAALGDAAVGANDEPHAMRVGSA
jgi:hypothetical protein